MFVCHEISAHAQKLEFFDDVAHNFISFVLIKILEFFDAVKNNRRNEVSRCYVAGFPTVAEIMIWPRRLRTRFFLSVVKMTLSAMTLLTVKVK